MDVKDVKVGEYYGDLLHDTVVYCAEIFERFVDESYIRAFYMEYGGELRETYVPVDLLNKEIIGHYDMKPLTFLDKNGRVSIKDGHIPKNSEIHTPGTIVGLAGGGTGIVMKFRPDSGYFRDELTLLSVSLGNLEEFIIYDDEGIIYPPNPEIISRFNKNLEENGFYYEQKFQFIFKKGDLKSNIRNYLTPPKDWEIPVASTISGDITGTILKDKSDVFNTTLSILDSIGNIVEMVFSNGQLRLPKEKEMIDLKYRLNKLIK